MTKTTPEEATPRFEWELSEVPSFDEEALEGDPIAPIPQCPVCLTDKADIVTLSCGHAACRECLCSWSEVRVAETEQYEPSIQCFAPGCQRTITDDELVSIGGGVLSTLNNARLNLTLRRMPDWRFCPYEACRGQHQVPQGGFAEPHCVEVQCRGCGQRWEEPWRARESLMNRVFSALCIAVGGAREADERASEAWKTAHAAQCNTCGAAGQPSPCRP